MTWAYIICRQLETGEVLQIASRNGLQEAEELVESLEKDCPGNYLIRSMAKEGPSISPTRLTAGDRTATNLDDHTRHFIKSPGSYTYRN